MRGETLNPSRRRPGSPVRSLVLKIAIRAGKEETARIMEAVPSAVVHGGVCEVNVEAREPAEIAEKTRVLLESLKRAA